MGQNWFNLSTNKVRRKAQKDFKSLVKKDSQTAFRRESQWISDYFNVKSTTFITICRYLQRSETPCLV